MAKKFTGWKEDEMELSDEIIKMYGVSDGTVASIMGISKEDVEKIKRRQKNATPEQIKRLLKEYGMGRINPPKGSTEKEKRLYAALTTVLKHLYRAMNRTN